MISVLMSVYNEKEEYLRQSVESILKQKKVEVEYIIVLDNPSNKELYSVLKEYERQDKRIKLVVNECNIGLTQSLNKAFTYSTGEYIARMDADDIAEENRLFKQLNYLNQEGLDLIGSQMRRISETGQVLNECTNKSYPSNCIHKLLLLDNCIPHPSWMFRRAVYEALGGYKEINSCEDYLFLLRAMKAGFKLGIADNTLMNYRINTNGISRNNSLKQLLSSEYLQKNYYRIDDVSNEEVTVYITKYITEKNKRHYECAVSKLNLYIEEMKKGKFFVAIYLPLLIIKSPFIFRNIVKVYKMQIIKRGKDKL